MAAVFFCSVKIVGALMLVGGYGEEAGGLAAGGAGFVPSTAVVDAAEDEPGGLNWDEPLPPLDDVGFASPVTVVEWGPLPPLPNKPVPVLKPNVPNDDFVPAVAKLPNDGDAAVFPEASGDAKLPNGEGELPKGEAELSPSPFPPSAPAATGAELNPEKDGAFAPAAPKPKPNPKFFEPRSFLSAAVGSISDPPPKLSDPVPPLPKTTSLDRAGKEVDFCVMFRG